MGVLVNHATKVIPERWTLKGILDNDVLSLICLLTDLAFFYGCPKIPGNVVMAITTTQLVNGAKVSKTNKHIITDESYRQSHDGY